MTKQLDSVQTITATATPSDEQSTIELPADPTSNEGVIFTVAGDHTSEIVFVDPDIDAQNGYTVGAGEAASLGGEDGFRVASDGVPNHLYADVDTTVIVTVTTVHG